MLVNVKTGTVVRMTSEEFLLVKADENFIYRFDIISISAIETLRIVLFVALIIMIIIIL